MYCILSVFINLAIHTDGGKEAHRTELFMLNQHN